MIEQRHPVLNTARQRQAEALLLLVQSTFSAVARGFQRLLSPGRADDPAVHGLTQGVECEEPEVG